jgi:signal transduction histidine kinase
MDQLLTGLLRLSRLGRIELIPARIDMNRLVPSILAALKHQAEQAQATIEVEDLPACRADAAQVNQMLTNFLDNALKYRHPDRLPSIRISGRVDGDAAIYCVEDNGPGIEPEHQDKIWGLFSRLEPRGPVPGEGLGLAAVRQMVWRNGGRAWVESAPGQGSRFFLSLPRAAESDGLDGPNGS